MKYMSFNRSCSYACIADMVSDYGLDFTDALIVKEMKLAYLFHGDLKKKEYKSGAMLQGKIWFDLFLNKYGLEFVDELVHKNNIINYLNNLNRKAMLGLNLENGKHAMVFYSVNSGIYKFMNPHYNNGKEEDFIIFSQDELLERVDEEIQVGYLRSDKTTDIISNELYHDSINYLRNCYKDLVDFCNHPQTMSEIKSAKESLFAPLLLTILPILELEKEDDLVKGLKEVQVQYIAALKTNESNIRLADYMDLLI